MCKVQKPAAGVLRLTTSRLAVGLQFGFTTVFLIAWYSFLFVRKSGPDDSSSLFMLLFWVAPLFGLPELLRQIRTLISGETFTLDRKTGLIERNGVRVARFPDVERVQIRTITGPESGSEYRLSIALKNGEKIRIAHSSNEEDMTAIAEELADLLNVEVGRKGSSKGWSVDRERD